MSAPASPPVSPTSPTAAPLATPPTTATADRPAVVPEEAQSHPVDPAAADSPLPPADTIAVANFRKADKAEAVLAELRRLGVPDSRLMLLTDKASRHRYLGGYHHDRPAVHTQASVAMAFAAMIGAVVLSVVALMFLQESPSIGTLFMVAFCVGLTGACVGGGAGWLLFRPADDPLDPLSDKVIEAGPAVAVREPPGGQWTEAATGTGDATDDSPGTAGGLRLAAVAKVMARGGGKVVSLTPHTSKAAAHPGDTRGEHFHDASPQAAPAAA